MTTTNYIWDFATESYLMEKDENGATTANYTNEPVQFGLLISQPPRKCNELLLFRWTRLHATAGGSKPEQYGRVHVLDVW